MTGGLIVLLFEAQTGPYILNYLALGTPNMQKKIDSGQQQIDSFRVTQVIGLISRHCGADSYDAVIIIYETQFWLNSLLVYTLLYTKISGHFHRPAPSY